MKIWRSLKIFSFYVLFSVFIALGVLATLPHAKADIKITSYSGYSNADTSSGSLTIRGGFAGVSCGTGPCDNCKVSVSGGTLTVCNQNHLSSTDTLYIYFTSTKTGRAIITKSTDNTIINGASTNTYTAGSTAAVTILWSALCAYSSGADSTCATDFSLGLYIGIDSDGDSMLNGANDEKTTLTIKGISAIPTATADCTTSYGGVCSYTVRRGDEKVFLRDLQKPSSFPNSGTVSQYSKIRMYMSRTTSTQNLDSAYVDIPMEIDSSQNVSVDGEVQGLINDTTYFFKLAMVDEAGNVGAFLSTEKSQTPSLVMGVLENNNCFIATAAYGSPLEKKLDTLRDFRNKYLFNNSLGLKFIRWYYTYGATYARAISTNETARVLTRLALWPLWAFAWLTLTFGFLNTLVLFLFSVTVLFFAYQARTRLRTTPTTILDYHRHSDDHRKKQISKFLVILLFGFAGLIFPTQKAQAQNSKIKSPTPATSTTKSSSTDAAADTANDDLLNELEPESDSNEPAKITVDESEPEPLAIEEEPTSKSTDVTSDVDAGVTVEEEVVSSEKPSWYESPVEKNRHSARQEKKSSEKIAHPLAKQGLKSISKEGHYQYKIKHKLGTQAVNISGGTSAFPNLRNSALGLSYKQIYSNSSAVALFIDYEYQLTRLVGKLGLKIGTGLITASGPGRFRSDGTQAEETYTLYMFPNSLGAILRLQFWDKQFLVPLAEAGGSYYAMVEKRDDNKRTKYNFAPATYFAGGVAFMLDALDSTTLQSLENDYGITHVWLQLGYKVIIGLNSSLDVSDSIINGGVGFEF